MLLTLRNRGSRSEFFGIAALLLLFAGFPIPSAAELGGKPEKTSFTLSYTQASGAFTPLWVAQEAGLFKKHGLELGVGSRCQALVVCFFDFSADRGTNTK